MAKSDLFIFSGRTPDNQEPFQDAENPLTMIIYGDLGIGSNAVFVKYLLEKEVKMREFLGIIHMGDIAYNMDQDDGIVGDTFFNMIQPLSANFAYMPTIGNHENKANSTHFKARFKLPKNKANQGTGYFYSYNLGAAHFIHISTELYTDDNKKESAMTQNNWLKQDLIEANNNRHIRPWIIVLTHHPLYCSVIHRECVEEAEMFQDILEDLWFDYGVDLMLEAHIHNYERDTPIYKNKTVKSQYDDYNTHINADATLYIVSGNAGNRKGHNDPVPKLKKDWAVYMTEDYGYGRLQVFNKTHMLWVQYSAINLTTIDHVWLIKDRLRFNNK